MAFNVVFYTFSKKDNSTARPSAAGVTYACTLKDGCGVLSPTLKLNVGPAANMSAYNYCHIPAFGRYYFITDWLSDRGMWYASMTVDVLASWKKEIGLSAELIVRAASETNGAINDQLYPIINDQVWYQRDGSATPWWSLVSGDPREGGVFIVGLLSYVGNLSVPGGVNYIGIGAMYFNLFMNAIFNTSRTSEPSAVEVQGDVIKTLMPGLTDAQSRNLAYIAENPYTDYIDSITYLPVGSLDPETGDPLDTERTIYLGPNPLRIWCHEINPKQMLTFSWETSNIPKHPQAATRGSYLNLEPYSKYSLNLPRVGLVPLAASKFSDYSHLTVELSVDPVTGEGLYNIYAGNGSNIKQLIHKTSTFLGVRIKIGTNKQVGTYLRDAAGLIGGLSGLMGGNITGLMGSIASIMHDTQAPGEGRIGDASGYNDLYPGYPTLYSQHFYVSGQDLNNCGAPLMAVRQIKALSGFVQCMHGDIAAPAMASELADIKRYLEGGFFYE